MSEMQTRIYNLIMGQLKHGNESAVDALAKDILEAMRPTEAELKAAGCDDDQSGAPYCADCSYLADQFGKFIDAALK